MGDYSKSNTLKQKKVVKLLSRFIEEDVLRLTYSGCYVLVFYST